MLWRTAAAMPSETPDEDRDREGPRPVGEGHREPLRDDLVDGLVLVAEGGAEIELGHDGDDVAPDLHEERLVEAVLAVQVGHDLGREGPLGVERTAGGGVHQHVGDDDEDEQRRYHHRESLEEVREHRAFQLRSRCGSRSRTPAAGARVGARAGKRSRVRTRTVPAADSGPGATIGAGAVAGGRRRRPADRVDAFSLLRGRGSSSTSCSPRCRRASPGCPRTAGTCSHSDRWG